RHDHLLRLGRPRPCGLMRVISEQPTRENPPSEPWAEEQKFRVPWWISLEPLVLLPADERAPHIDELGFDVERVRRKSYIPIGPGEFRKMEEAIRRAG